VHGGLKGLLQLRGLWDKSEQSGPKGIGSGEKEKRKGDELLS
jgi:hypothetical protein